MRCDWHLYKELHVIECMFGKLKYFRLITTWGREKSQSLNGNTDLCFRFVVAALICQQSLANDLAIRRDCDKVDHTYGFVFFGF